MSDAAPAQVKKAAKPKKPALHPKYNVMIAAAVSSLKERGGSSRQAILKYIMANYKVGIEVTKINARLKTALKAGVKAGTLKQAKGTGASGSFRLGEKKVAAKPKKAKKPKAKAAKKPAAKKATKSPKKAAAKKPKTAAKKAAKPKVAKSPAKKAATPKIVAKSPVKKVGKSKRPKTPKTAAAKKLTFSSCRCP